MIEVRNVVKKFNDICAVNNVSLDIEEGKIFGLVGTNGAGKSTLMRLIADIYRPDEGGIFADGEEVTDNAVAKKKIYYISDDQYFFPNATPAYMGEYMASVYDTFNIRRFSDLLQKFRLDPNRRIKTFSKGMKKQLSLFLGISSGTKYLLCDEAFDGLDPVMRQAVKSITAEEMLDRGMTMVVTSHNLRELEDMCDHVGLLHEGGVLLSKDIDDMKLNIHKVQCVLRDGVTPKDIKGLDVILEKKRGSLYTLTVRGKEKEIMNLLMASEPVFCEIIPLTLEEIFISETEVTGYDISSI